jgi:hypothetical protein
MIWPLKQCHEYTLGDITSIITQCLMNVFFFLFHDKFAKYHVSIYVVHFPLAILHGLGKHSFINGTQQKKENSNF